MPELKREENSLHAIRRYLDIFNSPFTIDNQTINITCSAGISIFPKDGKDADTLLKNADAAMHTAKLKGGNNFQFFTDAINVRINEHMILENNLRQAVKHNEFFLYYQPIVNLSSGQVYAAEALLRWNHPKLGAISPSKFIPLAEESGLINPLGEWTFRAACLQHQKWLAMGLPAIKISINLSPEQLKQAELVKKIQHIIQETKVDPKYLELELTESAIMDDTEFSIAKLQALVKLGIDLSIDDFGTGYSSLSYLRRFPVHTIKIDRSFVQDLEKNPDTAAIIKAIIALAKSLQLKVIAEGIETKNQVNFLKQNHCDYGQGYYFSPAVDADSFMDFSKNKLKID